MTLQNLANKFNELYITATRTSSPQDYLEATMVARQLVLSLDKEGVIADNFDEEIINQEGEVL